MAEIKVDLWVVTTVDISGVPHVAVTSSRDDAISNFLQITYLFIHAAPNEKFTVVGDDFDAALTGMHLIWEMDGAPLCVASVSRPASIGNQEGYVPEERDKKNFVDLATEIQAAINMMTGRLDKKEIEKLQHSSAVLHLVHSMAETMIEDERSDRENRVEAVSPRKAKKTWSEMAEVRQYLQMTAIVQGCTPGNGKIR